MTNTPEDRGNNPSRRVFIANENGDWWEHTPGQKVYIASMQDMINAGHFESEEEFDSGDNHASAIQQEGTPMDIPYVQHLNKKKSN
jgi:hypothetical protein